MKKGIGTPVAGIETATIGVSAPRVQREQLSGLISVLRKRTGVGPMLAIACGPSGGDQTVRVPGVGVTSEREISLNRPSSMTY